MESLDGEAEGHLVEEVVVTEVVGIGHEDQDQGHPTRVEGHHPHTEEEDPLHLQSGEGHLDIQEAGHQEIVPHVSHVIDRHQPEVGQMIARDHHMKKENKVQQLYNFIWKRRQ